jgi:hypothetical protein
MTRPRGDSTGRRALLWRSVGVAVVAIYAFRFAFGVRAGIAYARFASIPAGPFPERSLDDLSRAAVGIDRSELLWLRGETALGVYDAFREAHRPERDTRRILDDAAGSYLEAATLSPASGWPWTGLSGVFARAERSARDRRVVDLGRLPAPAWSHVGRAGRIAVGLVRKAIEREPTAFVHRDDLALLLYELGLREAAKEAIGDSARIQPVLVYHQGLDFSALPREYLETFAAASREVLGRISLQQPGPHHVSLGRMELMLGHPERAVADFTAAMREPIDSLTRAEAGYHLGLALMEAGRLDEASKPLEVLARKGYYPLQVADLLGRIAEKKGDLGEALRRYEEARRLDPVDVVRRSIEVARLASKLGEHGRAEAALRWALVGHPESTAARAALVRTYLAAGERADAEVAWEDLRKEAGDTPEVLRLREQIDGRP